MMVRVLGKRLSVRAVAAAFATVGILGTMLCYEAAQTKHPVAEALLFPEVKPSKKDSGAVAIAAAAIPAAALLPLALKPDTYEAKFVHRLMVKAPGLTEKNVAIEGPGGGTEMRLVKCRYIRDVKQVPGQAPGKNVAVLLLFDASDSILMNDPENLRIDGSEELIQKLPDDMRLSVGCFGADEVLGVGRARIDLRRFSTRHQNSLGFIASLKGKSMGGTPLFDALARSICSFASLHDASERHLICFADGEDNSSTQTPDDVAELAKEHGVVLSFVALGRSDWSDIRRLSGETGGRVVEADDATKLSGAFHELSKSFVKTIDNSHYELTLEAKRKKPFDKGERLDVTIKAAGEETRAKLQVGGSK